MGRWLLGLAALLLGIPAGATVLSRLKSTLSFAEEREVRAPVAVLELSGEGTVYLKDASAFIFTQAVNRTPLQFRDSIFVGPHSSATLLLSEELGGGRVELSENTIITITKTGKKSDIPSLDIKRGQIKIVARPPKASQPLVVSAGTRAVIVNEQVEAVPLSMGEFQQLVVEPLPTPSNVALSEPPREAPPILSMETMQEVGVLPARVANAADLEAARVPKEPESPLAAPSVSAVPDSTPTPVVVASPTAPAPVVIETPTAPAPAVVASPTVQPPKPIIAKVVSKPSSKPRPTPRPSSAPQRVPVVPQVERGSEDLPRAFSLVPRLDYVTRSSTFNTERSSSQDIDVGLGAEWRVNGRFALNAQVTVTALAITKQPSTASQRPLGTYGELAYTLWPKPEFHIDLVAGYFFKTVLGNLAGSTTYHGIFGPRIGTNFVWQFKNKSELLIGPRTEWVTVSDFLFEIPLSYSLRWAPYLGGGFAFSPALRAYYSQLRLKGNTAGEVLKVTTFGAGIALRF